MSTAPVVRLLAPNDHGVLDRVAPGVFDNAIDAGWAAEFLADPRHHMVVAMVGDEVIGMATGVHYIHPDKPPELWINEIGVAPEHQSRGIGKQLLQALFAQGRVLGCREAWLGTEQNNHAARCLYAAVGGREATMVYVTFDLDPAVAGDRE